MPPRLAHLVHQFGRFGLVGLVGLAVDVAVLALLTKLVGLGPYSARVGSYFAAATTTWALNRIYTFSGHNDGTLIGQWAKFLLANAFGGILNYTTYAILVATTPLVASYPAIGVAAGSIVGMFFNFTASKTWVFREKKKA